MDRFKILERCRERAEHWEHAAGDRMGYTANYKVAARFAALDWRTLEAEIEASIAEETDGLLRQEQGNAPPPSSAE